MKEFTQKKQKCQFCVRQCEKSEQKERVTPEITIPFDNEE